MFGYIKPDEPFLYMKDNVLYKATYCGLCKSIGKSCGQCGRFTLTYDLTFLSVFLHNLSGVDLKIEKQHCILHPIRKRPIALNDGLFSRIASLNVLLAYHKVDDDVIDNNKGRLKKLFLGGAYKKAKKKEPILNNVIEQKYAELISLEKENCDSIDRVADPFGTMMQEVCKELLKDKYSEEMARLFYSLGKWIYLIDALDDFDKDRKNGNYNVFVLSYKDVKDKKELIKEKISDLHLIFGVLMSDIIDCADKLSYNFNHDLTDNVLKNGLARQTKKIME